MKTWLIAASAIGGIFASDIIRLSAVILKENMEIDSMPEYIEREAAIESIMSEPQDAHYPHWYAVKIKSIPATDVVPVQHGRWLHYTIIDGHTYAECCKCHKVRIIDNYCSNCGALMDGE